MTIRECYGIMDADYDDVLDRLMNEKLIYRFSHKFADSQEYETMLKALEDKDYTLAFRMSHNLKGMSANLGLTGLYKTSSELCEALRGGEPTVDIKPLLEAVEEKYKQVLSGIEQMEEI